MGGRLAAATSAVVAAAAADRGSVVDVAPRVAACLRAFRRGWCSLGSGEGGGRRRDRSAIPLACSPSPPLARARVRACVLASPCGSLNGARP